MRMLKPSPGECVDRQTILELKMQHGQSQVPQKTSDVVKKHDVTEEQETTIIKTKFEGKSRINIQPFLDEHEAIQKYLESNWLPDIAAVQEKGEQFDSLYSQLLQVNGDLWILEDKCRAIRGDNSNQSIQTKAVYLDTISELNDKRAELVKSINTIWGMNTQEKLHYV